MEIKEIIVDNITADGCLSIRKMEFGEYQRRAFCPNQWDELERWAPNYKVQNPEIAEQINKLWTPKVIASWQQKQAEQEKML